MGRHAAASSIQRSIIVLLVGGLVAHWAADAMHRWLAAARHLRGGGGGGCGWVRTHQTHLLRSPGMSSPVPAGRAPLGRLHSRARRLRSSRGRSAQANAWSALPSGQGELPPPPPAGGHPSNSAASHARRSPNSQAACIPAACWLQLAFRSHPWRAEGAGVWDSQAPRCLKAPVI